MDSDDDVTITKAVFKGKRRAGEREEWSDDDDGNDVYERFKTRKSTKRKKLGRKPKKKKKEDLGTMTDSAEETSAMLDEIPEYLRQRRSEFDDHYKALQEAALKVPPRYDGIEFSDDEDITIERPEFPRSVKTSRPKQDIMLPSSAGIIPAPLARYLRDYQVEGAEFLHEAFVRQTGVILGDDMGLGKTIQVIAFLTAAFGKTADRRDAKRMRKMRKANVPWYPRILIVCPASLMENWRGEFNRWSWFHVDLFHGSKAQREDVLAAASAGRLEVVITTYQTYSTHRSQLNLIKWDCCIADEVHVIKERKSETGQAMLEVNALCRIGLTGTAIQNNYEELWTLLNWTNPGSFGDVATWKACISDPLRAGQSHDATLHQIKVARGTALKLRDNLLPRFFLRRMKTLIADQLPKKTDKVVFCPLTESRKSATCVPKYACVNKLFYTPCIGDPCRGGPSLIRRLSERDAYETFLASDLASMVRDCGDPCACGSGKKRGWCCHVFLPGGDVMWKALVFPVISALQKISNHLALLIPQASDTKEKQERDLQLLKKMAPDRFEELYKNRDSIFHMVNTDFCGKWRVLKQLLKFWHGSTNKVLIFSHSVRLLRMLQQLFNNTSWNVSFLDGSMTPADRQQAVDSFNADADQYIFLISTKAGGVGLNITSANKVIICDPNWNPSYDLQAQDRAYRIGQVRDVEVYRLVSAGTIEEVVYARQIYKQQQANIGYNASSERRYFKGVQSSKNQQGELFGLRNLLTFQGDDASASMLKDIVNKTNIAEAKYGINMVDVDMSQALEDDENPFLDLKDEKGDAALSQLVDLLTSGEDGVEKKSIKSDAKTDSNGIQAILAAAGVSYTHENSEVIGTSKVEAAITRRAEELGNDVCFGERRLFVDETPSASQASQAELDTDGPTSISRRGEYKMHYKFQPPEDVMMRQFCTMADMFGFKSPTEFGLVVESMTQKQRTACLNRFYNERRRMLAQRAEVLVDATVGQEARLKEDVSGGSESDTKDLWGVTPSDGSKKQGDHYSFAKPASHHDASQQDVVAKSEHDDITGITAASRDPVSDRAGPDISVRVEMQVDKNILNDRNEDDEDDDTVDDDDDDEL